MGENSVDARLRIQILGPLQLWRGDVELDAGPPQQAHLLAVLLARAGFPTSTDDLIGIIWGEAPPLSALNTLHKYIGVLRHLLEPNLAFRQAGSHLHRRGGGYVFTADRSTLDLVEYRELVTDARSAVAEQRDEHAMDSYVSALALWKGPVGAGLDSGLESAAVFAPVNAQFVETVVAASALARRLEQAERVLPALRMASAISPLHEPVQASLIGSLAASGQRAEALAAFQQVRTRLVEQLGIDPGDELVAAHRKVLDPTVTMPEHSHNRSVAAEPYRVADFSGRSAELESIRAFVADEPSRRTESVLLVSGPPGVGKTTTAVEALHNAGDRGAHLFVNLHGFDVAPLTALQVLRALLAQVHRGEAPPVSLDEASAAWRSAAATASYIVVLDNASSESQIRSVLAVDGPLTVIVTSRRTLPGLEATKRIALGPLPRPESERILAQLIPEQRRLASNLTSLAELCGDFPLALRIAGARIASRPQWSIDDFIERLRDEKNRLRQLVAGDLDVVTAFSLSYEALPQRGRELFRSLGLLHGSTFSARMVAAIDDLDPDACRDDLDALADLGLVEMVHGDRYRMHDLIRLYAADRLRDELSRDEIREQQVRFDRWILKTTSAAAMVFPDGWAPVPEVSSASVDQMRDAERWLTTESSHWFAALKSAAELGEHRLVVDTVTALTRISNVWVNWPDWVGVHSIGAESASERGDHDAFIVQLVAIAVTVGYENPGPGDRERTARRALATAESLGNRRWIGWSRVALSEAHFANGDFDDARREALLAKAEFVSLGDFNAELLVRSYVLWTLSMLDAEESLAETRALVKLVDGLGPTPERFVQPSVVLDTFTAACRVFRSAGLFDEALTIADRMLKVQQPFLAEGYAAIAQHHRGFALIGLHRFDEAREAFEVALRWTNPYLPPEFAGEIHDVLRALETT